MSIIHKRISLRNLSPIKTVKRQYFNILLIVFIAVLFFWVGTAFGITEETEQGSKPIVYQEKRRPVTTNPAPTTTTTTVPLVERKLSQTEPVAVQSSVPVLSGSPQEWMREAGIPESDWPQAELLVSREGGWRPCVHNGGTIDCNYDGPKAYGIPQSMPGSKMASMGADWRTNPVTQLKWMKAYVEDRYGTWANANRMWESRSPHWY